MTDSKKRGPTPDRLKIDGDPGEALDRLLGKDLPPTDEAESSDEERSPEPPEREENPKD